MVARQPCLDYLLWLQLVDFHSIQHASSDRSPIQFEAEGQSPIESAPPDGQLLAIVDFSSDTYPILSKESTEQLH